jgi:HD-GYP domain-containing protein (c-di-GMP phosphodiesterase class II)
VYAPLLAGSERIGVLVVFRRDRDALDGLHRRTIATVGAQLALTAQNLQLIDRLRETFESSIAAVAGAVEARDGYTDQHCRRLAAFSSLMGRRLGMPEDQVRAMELGALLHDVGKIGVPDAILNKPGRLTDEERVQMQKHPEIGAGIVAPVVGLEKTTLDCVIHHHERWDGDGYPEGLVGDEIPLAARIVSIVDVWDALSTARPYKAAYPQSEVRDRLLKGRGTQFDPDLIDLFFEVLEDQGEEMLELVARSSSQANPS